MLDAIDEKKIKELIIKEYNLIEFKQAINAAFDNHAYIERRYKEGYIFTIREIIYILMMYTFCMFVFVIVILSHLGYVI